MIRSVSIIIVWILAVEAGRIIIHSRSADADKRNCTEGEKWNNEIDNADYNDDDDDDGGDDDDNDNGFANKDSQNSEIYKDKIIDWKGSDDDKEHLINDESQDDNNIITAIVINNAVGNESNGENVSKKEEDDEIDKAEYWSSAEEANMIDYLHSISSIPKDHIWLKKGINDEDLDVVIKTNVKRVKRVSRAGNSRKVRLMQERRNRLDNSNSLENQNRHKYKVTNN